MADSDIAIVGLQPNGGASQIGLTWLVDDPNAYGLPYRRFAKAELRYSFSADMASPVSLGFASTAKVDAPVPRGETRWYQARAIDQSGREGDWSDPVPAREISGDVLIASPGYWKLPNGLILQWGFSGDSVAGFARADFALPFPNDCFVCIGVTSNNNNLYVFSSQLDQLFLDHALFLITAIFENAGVLHRDGAIDGARVWWLAVGY